MLPNLVVYGLMFGSSLRFTCSRFRPLFLADYWLIPEKASLVPILVLVPNGLACCCAYTAQVLVLGAIMKD